MSTGGAPDWRVDRPAPEELANPPDVLVARLAAEQDGVISLRQLRACGVSSDGVTTRVRSGRLHRIYRGVYAVGHVAVPVRGRLRAAALAAGLGGRAGPFGACRGWGTGLGNGSFEGWTEGWRRPREGRVRGWALRA
jgi:hypothetical protein